MNPRPARASERWDAVVIGGGLSGATAAALLAARGHRVVVVERDQHAGGCAASFEQQGYAFAVGATVGMGLEPGGVVRRVYDRLGIAPRYTPVDPAIRVLVGDRTVDLHADRQAWAAELARAFPGQARGKRAFWTEVARLARGLAHAAERFPVMPFADPRDALDTAAAAHPSLLPVLLGLRRSVADLLAAHGVDDPFHRAFIDGQLVDAMQTTADDCAAPNGALALDVYRRGAQYLHGGLRGIAEDFLEVVRRRGGSVRFATRARGILVDDRRRVVGVATRTGELLAPVVVSTVPLANTAALVGDDVRTRLHQRARSHQTHWGPFMLYLGVDERALPADVHPFLQVTDVAPDGGRTPVHDGGNLLISISPAFDADRAPAGKRAITVSTHVDAASWLDLAERPADYAAAKERMTERLLGQMERLLPDLRSGLDVVMAGTPRTFERYTRRAGGTAGGFPQTVANANFAAPSHRTDIDGLFLAGDTVFPGQGALGVTISGHNAARSGHRHLLRGVGRRLRPVPHHARGRRSVETQEVTA